MHGHHLLNEGFTRFLIPLLVGAAMVAIYLAAASKHKHANRSWSIWRTISFVLGVSLSCVAMWPSLVKFAHQDIRGHMIQHLLIGMLAPIGLVMGAPVTLALKTLPHKAARSLTSILRSRPFHLISHPLTAFILNIGGMYLLYLTPLYAATLSYHYLHHIIHIHFIAAGYLFTWSIVGPDPAPGRPKFNLRLWVLFLSIAAHAYLSKYMYAHLWPRGTDQGELQIHAAAKIMYYGGDFAELLLIIIFFAVWYQKKDRPYYRIST